MRFRQPDTAGTGTSRRRRRVLAGIAGSVLGVGALLAPAATAAGESAGQQASDSGPDDQSLDLGPSTSEPTEQNPHCSVSLAPEGSTAASEPVEQQCFGRFSDAVAYSTDGEVRLPRSAGPGELDLDSEVAVATTLLGVLYNGTGYDGSSQVLNGTGKGCYAGRTYAVNDLDDLDFDNRASSFKVRSNCLGRLYAGTNKNGDKYLCEDNCSSLGKLNNRASSIKFF